MASGDNLNGWGLRYSDRLVTAVCERRLQTHSATMLLVNSIGKLDKDTFRLVSVK